MNEADRMTALLCFIHLHKEAVVERLFGNAGPAFQRDWRMKESKAFWEDLGPLNRVVLKNYAYSYLEDNDEA